MPENAIFPFYYKYKKVTSIHAHIRTFSYSRVYQTQGHKLTHIFVASKNMHTPSASFQVICIYINVEKYCSKACDTRQC